MNPARRRLVVLGAVGATALAAGAMVGVVGTDGAPDNGIPALLASHWPDVEGRERSFSEWQNRVRVVNFWASWCAPCREEIPLLEEARKTYGTNGFEIVGIAVDNAANVAEFRKNVQISYPLLIAGSAAVELIRALGNRAGGLPYTVVLDVRDQLVETRVGEYRRGEIERAIERAFKNAAPR